MGKIEGRKLKVVSLTPAQIDELKCLESAREDFSTRYTAARNAVDRFFQELAGGPNADYEVTEDKNAVVIRGK